MLLRLLCLHGFTQNGELLRKHMQPLSERFPAQIEVRCPDGANECAPESVARMSTGMFGEISPPPHRCFYDSTNDGRVYRGMEASIEALREQARGAERVALLGFSQGACMSAALCALAQHGEFPKIEWAVLVAGRAPRADALLPYLQQPIALPSLHVWGTRDSWASQEAPKLVERFDAAQRTVVSWKGPHILPTRGEAADAIVEFVKQRAG
jgi:pimeloyl-ACP methyl ester carboxylesterase